MESIKEIRQVLIVGTLFALFFNLFDCIKQNAPLIDFLFYIGTLLGIFLFLVLTTSKWPVIASLVLVGVLTMIDIPTPNYLSAGVIFIIFAMRVAENNIFSFTMYFSTVLIVVGTHVYNAVSPADAVNILVAYSVIYLFEYLFYTKQRG